MSLSLGFHWLERSRVQRRSGSPRLLWWGRSGEPGISVSPGDVCEEERGEYRGEIYFINILTPVMIFPLTLDLTKLLGLRVDGLKGGII